MGRYFSPNGSEIVGTLEHLTARAEITGIERNGDPIYMGETEVFWDSQTTQTRNGAVIFLDHDGMEWTFDQLVWEEDDVDA